MEGALDGNCNYHGITDTVRGGGVPFACVAVALYFVVVVVVVVGIGLQGSPSEAG